MFVLGQSETISVVDGTRSLKTKQCFKMSVVEKNFVVHVFFRIQ